MISYNNNDYDKKSRRKQVRRRRTFHRAVCIILCLFMGAAVFGAVSLISVGKEASPPGKRSAENTGGFLDINAEVELWTKIGHIKVNLRKGVDIRKFDKLIANAILK